MHKINYFEGLNLIGWGDVDLRDGEENRLVLIMVADQKFKESIIKGVPAILLY